MRLSGGAEAWLAARHRWASLLYFASTTNRLIDAAVQALRRHLHEGQVGVLAQMALTTWVTLDASPPHGRSHAEALRARTAHLAAHVQSWGGCTVREVTGHPVKAWVSTVPGLSQLHIGTRYAAPLREVIRSPAVSARLAVAGRSDGLPVPRRPTVSVSAGSPLQGTWNELYFARPGSGKSVAMALNNLALILSPGFRELPFVRIIDIGPSSEGFDCAGAGCLAGGAAPRGAIPCAAKPGGMGNQSRWIPPWVAGPPPQKRAFLVSLLSVLATAPARRRRRRVWRKRRAWRWIAPTRITATIKRRSCTASTRTPPSPPRSNATRSSCRSGRPGGKWWMRCLTSAISRRDPGATLCGALAQRSGRRGPGTASHPSVRGRDAVGGDGGIAGAMVQPRDLGGHPRMADAGLSDPVRPGQRAGGRFDVAALCGDMTPSVSGKPPSPICWRCMCSVTMCFGTRPPPSERPSATAPITATGMNACGRTHANSAWTKTPLRWYRRHRRADRALDAEGRKANVHTAVASQILSDFSDDMAELATTIHIMEYSSDDQAAAVRAKFSLSAAALAALRTYGTGPTAAGAPFLGCFGLGAAPSRNCSISPPARSSCGRCPPRRKTAGYAPSLPTTRTPPARAALARAYPGGSAKAELERRLDHGDGTLDREAVLAQLVEEVAALAPSWADAPPIRTS